MNYGKRNYEKDKLEKKYFPQEYFRENCCFHQEEGDFQKESGC